MFLTTKDEEENLLPSFDIHDYGFVNAVVAYYSFGDPNDVLHFDGYTNHPELPNRSSILIKVEVWTRDNLQFAVRKP